MADEDADVELDKVLADGGAESAAVAVRVSADVALDADAVRVSADAAAEVQVVVLEQERAVAPEALARGLVSAQVLLGKLLSGFHFHQIFPRSRGFEQLQLKLLSKNSK